METYFMIGKTTTDAIRTISSNRTEKAIHMVREMGGDIVSMHALIGGIDYIIVVNFPTMREAMKASLALSVLTGISFATYPAITLGDFDSLAAIKDMVA